jgi:hypothetical protein
MEGPREGAAAHQLDGFRALLGKIGERLHQLLVKVRSGGVPGPGPTMRRVGSRRISVSWNLGKQSEHRFGKRLRRLLRQVVPDACRADRGGARSNASRACGALDDAGDRPGLR